MTTTADEVWEALRELVESQKQTELQMRETGEQLRENGEQLRETREQFREIREQFQEVRRLQQETGEQMKKTDRKIKELGKQIGGLADKFGSFTEGLALPSMEKILSKQFKMEVISPRVRVRKGGEEMEIDVLAYGNGAINTAYVVEVKSHAKEEAIEQLKNILNRFRHFFPEHQNKQVYGILTAVDMSVDVRNKALQEGLYVARIHNDIFQMDTPKDFQPQSW